MRNFIKLIVFASVIGLFFITCKEEEVENFNGKDLVYFEFAKKQKNYLNNNEAAHLYATDSIPFTFVFEEDKVKDTLLKIPVKVQGYTSSKTRVVNLQVMETSTAKEGVDFTMPDKIEIPADSVRAYIPIRVYRTPKIKTEPVSLDLKLLPNDDFQTNLTGKKKGQSTNKVIKYDQCKISLFDFLLEPPFWSWNGEWQLGDFSEKKLRLVVKLAGVKLSFYRKEPARNFVDLHTKLLRRYLKKMKNEGHTVYEKDGKTPMAISPFFNN